MSKVCDEKQRGSEEMMSRLFKACLLVVVAFPTFGQDSSPRATVPLIAYDSHHRPIAVSLQSLVITDQKVPVTGASLLPGSDLPLELGILIDTSNSRRDSNLGGTLKAMNQFVSETVQGPEDRVFLLTFGATPQMTEWLNKEKLQKTTVQVGSGGGTAIYDSLAIACQQRLGPSDWSKPARRILVLISDGGDNLSRTTPSEAVAEALKSGAVIFTMDTNTITSLISERDRAAGVRAMEYLAEVTGGEFFGDIKRQEIPKAFAKIRERIDALYYLRYLPPSTSNKALHEVELKPAPKEKLKLSYARRYFWNP